VKPRLKLHAGVKVAVEERENPCALKARLFLNHQSSGEACSSSVYFITHRTIILFHGIVYTVFGVLFTYG